MRRPEKGIQLIKIGLRLRRLRLQNEKTAKEVAYLLGITRQAYGNIERGKCDVAISKLIILAAFYKISFIELIPEEFRNFDIVAEIIEIAGKISMALG